MHRKVCSDKEDNVISKIGSLIWIESSMYSNPNKPKNFKRKTEKKINSEKEKSFKLQFWNWIPDFQNFKKSIKKFFFQTKTCFRNAMKLFLKL